MDKRLKIISRYGFSFLRLVKLQDQKLFMKYQDSQILKTKNTCNKLEEDACGLASGSKVRETLSSPVSLNLNKESQDEN